MENSKSSVLVLSRNYSTGLGVIRSLGMAGYPVDLIASVKKQGSSIITSSSKYVRMAKEVLTKQIQGDAGSELVEELIAYGKQNTEKTILFPTDDFTTTIMDANRSLLKEYFFMPETTDGCSLMERMDKDVQTRLAREVGLAVPNEWIISLEDIIIPETMVYPCFVKPLQSVNGQKMEMKKCDSYEELHAHLKQMQSFFASRKVLVQEYLEIEKEYDLSGVCFDDEIIIPGLIEKTRVAKYERGVTMSGTMIDFNTLEIKDKIIEMLKSYHYVGMFDMEIIYANNTLYFNEVNLRSGGPNFAYCLNGTNLPALYVSRVLHEQDVYEKTIKEYNKTFVYEKVAWEDYIHGYMTKKELENCINQSDYTLLANKEDPEPGKIFNKRIRLSMAKQRVKGFLKGKRNG